MSPTSGIFSASMSHTNPQVNAARSYSDSRGLSPRESLVPNGRGLLTCDPSNPSSSWPQRERLLDEPGDPPQLGHSLGHLVGGQPRDALDPEFLDVERRERRAVGHRAT